MKPKRKPGPRSDAETLALVERAAAMRPHVQASLRAVLAASDAKVAKGEEIPFSWLGYMGKLLADERAGAMWDAADGGEDPAPPR